MKVLTYMTLPYNGRGPARTCIDILTAFPTEGVACSVFLPRATASISEHIKVIQCAGEPLARLPFKPTRALMTRRLNARFRAALDKADPKDTVAYFWPGAPTDLLRHAQQRRITSAREMINCYLGQAKPILDEAYARNGMQPIHGITEPAVEAETRDLRLHDFIFAPTQTCAALEKLNLPGTIVRSAFGWKPSRYSPGERNYTPERPLTFIFVGTLCVRKGVLELLEAWDLANRPGKLILVGGVDPQLKPRIKALAGRADVEWVPFTNSIGDYYSAADVFVFPSYEEGGPQVTFEAAGFGLPILTTPMGAGAIVRDQITGRVVEAGDSGALAEGLRQLTSSADERARLGRAAKEAADCFTFEKIARRRAEAMLAMVSGRAERALELT